jgi:hypothetical protein
MQACKLPPGHAPDHPVDHPPYESYEEPTGPIEIVTSEPNRSEYELVGDVEGESKAFDLAAATREAREDLRRKGAAMGGVLAVLDTNTAGPAKDFTGRHIVVLNGRVFRKKRPRH